MIPLPGWPGQFVGHPQLDCDIAARNKTAQLAYWESRCRVLVVGINSIGKAIENGSFENAGGMVRELLMIAGPMPLQKGVSE